MWAIVSLHSSRTISELRQHNQRELYPGAVTQLTIRISLPIS